jgi:hypothetical protein
LPDQVDELGTNYLSVRGFVRRVGQRPDGRYWAQIMVGSSPTGEEYLLVVAFEEAPRLNVGDFVESHYAYLTEQKRILCPRLIPRGRTTRSLSHVSQIRRASLV